MTNECRRLTDRESVLSAVDLWNERHPEFTIAERLVEQNIYGPFDGLDVAAWGCYDGDDAVGFVLAKTLTRTVSDYAGPDHAWLSLLAVDADGPNPEAVARSLLDTAETGLSETGAETVRFGGDPQNFLPGLPTGLDAAYREVLEAAGYEPVGTVYDLERDVSSFEPPERVARARTDDLTVERVGPATVSELLAFLEAQFPGRWHYEAVNVVRRPGGADDYWLLRHGETVVGFARTNAPSSGYRGGNANWGWRLEGESCGLGPLGIHPDFRGRGWGLYLLSSVIDSLRADGVDRTIIDWTDLLDYYATLGFEPWLEYTVLRKEL